MRDEFKKVEKKITDLIPVNWFKDPANSSVWMTGFRIVKGEKSELANGYTIDLIGTRAFVLYGQIAYIVNDTNWELNEQGIPSCKVNIKNIKTPVGFWLIIMAPYKVDGIEGNEANVKRAISSSTGFLAAFTGRNAVYEKIYENIFDIGSGYVTVFGPVSLNPGASPKPNFSRANVALINEAVKKIANLEERTRSRLGLAFHWYEKALKDSGRDAFLKSWIALEVLAMPDSTNIRPINEALARTYGKTIDETIKTFVVGRIFGLRSRIVHDGEVLPIKFVLEEYIQAIFADVLCDMLQITPYYQAEVIRNKNGFDFEKILTGN
jgi:hypothetical protein